MPLNKQCSHFYLRSQQIMLFFKMGDVEKQIKVVFMYYYIILKGKVYIKLF